MLIILVEGGLENKLQIPRIPPFQIQPHSESFTSFLAKNLQHHNSTNFGEVNPSSMKWRDYPLHSCLYYFKIKYEEILGNKNKSSKAEGYDQPKDDMCKSLHLRYWS